MAPVSRSYYCLHLLLPEVLSCTVVLNLRWATPQQSRC